MKKTLYLHIGMGKTGTTSLQNFFWENRKRLRQLGIGYPKYGTVANAHHLISPNIPPPLAKIWDFKTVAQWAPVISKERQSKILLSSELIAWAKAAQVMDFCAEIREWFNVKIVIYLRRQDNIIMASYNQQIRAGQQKRHIVPTLKGRLSRFDYLKIISPWVEGLGEENIKVCVYEKQQFYKGDIRRDFMHRVFNIEMDKKFSLGNKDYNPRMEGTISEYKIIVNNLIDDEVTSSRFNELLIAYAKQEQNSDETMFTDYAALSTKRRLKILEASQEINATIARQYLDRPDGILFFDPMPGVDKEGVDSDGGLDISQANSITRYLLKNDKELMLGLAEDVEQNLKSGDRKTKLAAHLLQQSLQDSGEDSDIA